MDEDEGFMQGHLTVLSWAIVDIWAHLIKSGAASKLDAGLALEKLAADARKNFPNTPAAAQIAELIAAQLLEQMNRSDSQDP